MALVVAAMPLLLSDGWHQCQGTTGRAGVLLTTDCKACQGKQPACWRQAEQGSKGALMQPAKRILLSVVTQVAWH
jgi:hypothetical protein